jgi:microcystin-dependent protein
VTLTHTAINNLPADIVTARTAVKNTLDPHGYTTIGGAAAATVVPKGSILMWNHNSGAIPTGWRLCDGGTYNAVVTPDLRSRFVLGQPTGFSGTRAVAESISVSNAGGHTHTIDAVTLTLAQIPAHGHRIYTGANSPGGTTAILRDNIATAAFATGSAPYIEEVGGGGSHNHALGTEASHTHSVYGVLPVHYILAYICFCAG